MANENELPLRSDIPADFHPGTADVHRVALEVPNTIGERVIKEGRVALGRIYSTHGLMLDARRAAAVVNSDGAGRDARGNVRGDVVADFENGGLKVAPHREAELRSAMEQAFAKLSTDVDKSLAAIRTQRDAISKAIDSKLTYPQSKTVEGVGVAAEVRAYARTLSGAKKETFMQTVAQSGDLQTLSALLTGPTFLSGFDESDRAYLRDAAAKVVCPQDRVQLIAADRLLAHIEKSATSFAVNHFARLLPRLSNSAQRRKQSADALTALGA